MFRRLAAVAVVFALLIPQPVTAYAFTGSPFTLGAVTDGIGVCFGNQASGPIYANRTRILNEGADNWVDAIDVDFVSEGSCVAGQGNILIRETSLGGCSTNPVNYAATYNIGDGSHQKLLAVNAACLASVIYWGPKPVPNDKVDGPSLIAHEIGHALGLCHSNETACGGSGNGKFDVMDIGGPQNADCKTGPAPFQGRRLVAISADDQDGAQALYPSLVTGIVPFPDADCVA